MTYYAVFELLQDMPLYIERAERAGISFYIVYETP